MKALTFFILCIFITFSLLAAACKDGGGGSTDAGTITMSVTDAKPSLPANVSNFFIEFSEVWVHKSGGGWQQLPLVESSYTIDLLEFQNENTTELVLPTKLDSGKYTQVRIGVNSATLRFDNGATTEDRPVEIPSENLKTDKNFIFDVPTETAVELVIHFDLSMSLIVSGTDSNPSYKLKPVLHLFGDPLRAATIQGSIDNSSFGLFGSTNITVFAESSQEEYTRVEIPKSTTADQSGFLIYWIVPDQTYTVQIDLNQDGLADCEQIIEDIDLPQDSVFELNGGNPIQAGAGICS